MHATGTLPSGPKSIGRMACGPYRLGGRSRTGSTGCRCVAAHWRFWTRHGRSWREPARSCFPIGSVSSSRRSNCAGCSGSTGSRPCHTGFARASGTGRPKRRIIPARSSRQPWRTSSRTGLRRPIGVRTCSSADAGSWVTGKPTSVGSLRMVGLLRYVSLPRTRESVMSDCTICPIGTSPSEGLAARRGPLAASSG